jgi:hypothetical protein
VIHSVNELGATADALDKELSLSQAKSLQDIVVQCAAFINEAEIIMAAPTVLTVAVVPECPAYSVSLKLCSDVCDPSHPMF